MTQSELEPRQSEVTSLRLHHFLKLLFIGEIVVLTPLCSNSARLIIIPNLKSSGKHLLNPVAIDGLL